MMKRIANFLANGLQQSLVAVKAQEHGEYLQRERAIAVQQLQQLMYQIDAYLAACGYVNGRDYVINRQIFQVGSELWAIVLDAAPDASIDLSKLRGKIDGISKLPYSGNTQEYRQAYSYWWEQRRIYEQLKVESNNY